MIHEPMTLATDYLLAAVSAFAGCRLFAFDPDNARASRRDRRDAPRLCARYALEADGVNSGRGERVSQDARFIWVVIDSGVAFLGVALLHLVRRDAAWGWAAGGVGLSLAAGAAQASKIDLHPHFNHNDLYHLIEVAAILAFYRGIRRMTDLEKRV